MKKNEKKEIKVEEEAQVLTPTLKTELEELHELFQELKDRGFNSIGDVENRIAHLQK